MNRRFVVLILVSLFGAVVQAQTLTYTCHSGVANEPWTCAPVTTGLTPPLTFSVASGSLPSWLKLDPNTGLLSGTPPYSFYLAPNAPTNLKAIIAKLKRIERKRRTAVGKKNES